MSRGTRASRAWQPWWLVLLVAASATSVGRAAEGDRSLAALVADDVGLCVEVRHLAVQFDEYRTTELCRRLEQFPPLKSFLTKNAAGLSKLAADIRLQTGLSADEVLRKLLGRQFLLGIWPDDKSKAQDGQALLILKSTDAGLLARTVVKLLEAQRAAGWHVESHEWRFKDATHVIHRIEPGPGQPPIFFTITGELGIVATDEHAVRSALEYHEGANAARSLADLPDYAAGVARLNPDALVQMFANPRAWTAVLAKCIDDKHTSAMHRRLLEAFQHAEYLVVSLQLAPRLVLEGFLRTDRVNGANQQRPGVAPREELGDRLPDSAIVALAGRIDLASLVSGFFRDRMAHARGTKADTAPQDRLDVMALAALTSGRGYNAVAALVDRSAGDPTAPSPQSASQAKAGLALDWIVGLDTGSLLPDDQPTLANGLDPLVRAGLTAAIVMYNRQGHNVRVESNEEQGVPLTSVNGISLFGHGETATFASLRQFYWAGSSRDVVRDVARLDVTKSLSADARFQAMANPRLRGRTHLAYLQLARLCDMLAAGDGREEPAATDRAPHAPGPHSDWIPVLQLADRLLFEARVDADGVAVSATLTAESRR